jgi:hypothetical protein
MKIPGKKDKLTAFRHTQRQTFLITAKLTPFSVRFVDNTIFLTRAWFNLPFLQCLEKVRTRLAYLDTIMLSTWRIPANLTGVNFNLG